MTAAVVVKEICGPFPVCIVAEISKTQTLEEPKTEKTVLSSPLPYQPTNLEQVISKVLAGRCILFGEGCDPYFAFLDNDCLAPFEFGGIYYKCATAAYEAQKFPPHRTDLGDRFKTLNAKEALAFSAEKHLEKNLEWYGKREEMMFNVLRAKFGQNYTLQRLLLLTVDSYLSFHTLFKRMDPFWTDDSDGTGRNRLGCLLMLVRKEYGGIGETSLPENYHQYLPKVESKKTLTQLDKSDSGIFSEIHDLNAQINDDVYKLHSQIARCEENQQYTRFQSNNFPYDTTLVPLSSGKYINASFVLGKKFIGTQSPMPHTTEDFWSMILEHNVSIVIMLNRLTDPGDDIYFPFSLSDKKNYGKIHLELIEEPFFKTDPSWRQTPHEEEPHAVIHRKVKIWRDGEGVHMVNHFQYHNWRDFSAGNERAAAYLVKAVHGLRNKKSSSPIVVHCHAGVGRTSAAITLIDQFEHLLTGEIDIKRSVERQRSPTEGRCNSMIQSPDQYLFCYRTLRLLSDHSI